MSTRDCGHITAMSSPSIGEAGKTGEWRTERPVINHERCIPSKRGKPSCFLCWFYCPEAVIRKSIPVEVNLDYCKGCGICAAECPAAAITMISENSA